MKRFLPGRPSPCPRPPEPPGHRRHADGLRRPCRALRRRRRGAVRPSGRPAVPRRGSRTGAPRRTVRMTIRKVIPKTPCVTGLIGVRSTAGRLVWPRHARHPVAEAICDGARSWNDYSSGRRERLEAAVEIRSPRITDKPLREAHPQCIRQSAMTDARQRLAVPGGLHAAQTTHGQTRLGPNFTPNNASRTLGIVDVTPLTKVTLVEDDGQIYRADVSSRYISTA